MNRLILSAAVLSVISMLTVAISGCGAGSSMEKAEELEPVEIRDYEGEKLSSVNDFRENSIEGPQQVEIESYRLEIAGLVENPESYTYDEALDSHQHY